MMEIAATNVVASLPPERRPTGISTARAKSGEYFIIFCTPASLASSV